MDVFVDVLFALHYLCTSDMYNIPGVTRDTDQIHQHPQRYEHISVSCLAEHMGHSHVLLATFEKVREMFLLIQTIEDNSRYR